MKFELHSVVPFEALDEKLIREYSSAAEGVIHIPQNFVFSIAIVSDEEIRKMNKQYRNKDKPTDVLSFRYDDNHGEIVLSADRIRAQAKEYGHSVEAEAAFNLIHGILHIQGWDHERSAEEAKEMSSLEKRIIELCGLEFAR